MANLKSIKNKIISSKKMGTVTRAMEAVSAVKMRKSQERALSGRSYAASALSVLERLSSTVDLSRHALMQERSDSNVWGNVCFIVITSDKGLAGALNSGVIRKVEREINDRGLRKEDVTIAPIGRKARDYFTSRGYHITPVMGDLNVSDDVSEEDAMVATNVILVSNRMDIRAIRECYIVYQNFISSFEQVPTVRKIIPVQPETIREIVAGIRPARGKYAPSLSEHSEAPAAYTVEPDADAVLSVLLPKLINIAIFHALLENKASEHSARMVAMKSATDKAKEMAQAFTRKFNKVRQAVITREVSEITSGIEAMK
jgi:F-type H+-transporting ATPase subunit gamma